jgi:hypothetical protein
MRSRNASALPIGGDLLRCPPVPTGGFLASSRTGNFGHEGTSTAPTCSSGRTAMRAVESARQRGEVRDPIQNTRGCYGRWTAVRLTVYSSPPRLSLSKSLSPGAFFISAAMSEAAAPAIGLPST